MNGMTVAIKIDGTVTIRQVQSGESATYPFRLSASVRNEFDKQTKS